VVSFPFLEEIISKLKKFASPLYYIWLATIAIPCFCAGQALQTAHYDIAAKFGIVALFLYLAGLMVVIPHERKWRKAKDSANRSNNEK
jgi:surface polysaccharide O-acyltransferase-like enzyme